MKKYFIRPGYIKSQYDVDTHFISAGKLINLYMVQPSDCVTIPYDDDPAMYEHQYGKLRHLHPRYRGDYDLE